MFSCWKEQFLNYKFCTKHIFSGRVWKGGKAKTQTPLKTFLQLHHIATSFSIFLNFFNSEKEWKKYVQ